MKCTIDFVKLILYLFLLNYNFMEILQCSGQITPEITSFIVLLKTNMVNFMFFLL